MTSKTTVTYVLHDRPYIKSEEEFDEIVEKAKHETSSKTDRTQMFVSNPKLGYI